MTLGRVATSGLLVAATAILVLAILGSPEALGYLGPLVAFFAMLALGSYPGERILLQFLAARTRVGRSRSAPVSRRGRLGARVPRGSLLLSTGLAGRAPPPAVV
jgi:hypothetical protein